MFPIYPNALVFAFVFSTKNCNELLPKPGTLGATSETADATTDNCVLSNSCNLPDNDCLPKMF